MAANVNIPIIFITGHGDIPMSVQAMKGGAIDFPTKPFRDQDLLDVDRPGTRSGPLRSERDLRLLRKRFATLSSREREVMAHVVNGRLNKQIAGDIGISLMTVKIHRGHLMRKMGAASATDLARMADKLRNAALYR